MHYKKKQLLILPIIWFYLGDLGQAQVIPDNTLPKNSTVNSDCTSTCQVDGGTTKGNNLFHSFEQFSVPTKGEVTFNNNNAQIKNIFTRVTGSSISNIDGVIRAQGSANFFLINPNGIIFGNNAQLDVRGSFLATTAESIFFADKSQFSATNPQASSLLTVSVPIGLQFGETPGAIVNKSQAKEVIDPKFPDFTIDIGLKVDDGKTLALVGNGVSLDGGALTAFEGRIELGSVGANSFVNLAQDAEGFILGYGSVNQFADIFIIKDSELSASTNQNSPSGNIQIYGKTIEVKNSNIDSLNESKSKGGKIFIEAAETFTLQDSEIDTKTFSTGKAGSITLNANLVELIKKKPSIDSDIGIGLFSQTALSSGKAGDIEINTNRLILEGGAQIGVSTFGSGEGGNLTVNASDSIKAVGRTSDGQVASGLFAQSLGGKATGDAGNLTINTGSLVVTDGAKVSVGAIERDLEGETLGISEGNGGNLIINATKSIEVSGFSEDKTGKVFPSTLLSESQGSGDAGNLEVTTPELTVADGGEINVSATGTGEAGSLNIQARNLTLDRGTLIAETKSGDQGNITLSNLDTLLMRNISQINTNAKKEATGGNITIDSTIIGLLDKSTITANADKGKGGNISITTQWLIQEQNTVIDASSKKGIDGTVTIYSPYDPASGIIELADIPIDVDAILTRNLCRLEEAKIAQGSSLIITGRGGLTPTAEDSLDNVENVVRWTNPQSVKVSQNGLVGVSQRSLPKEASQTKDLIVRQSQGWVTTADGSVWLVANSPESIPQNSQISPNNCQVFQ